MKRLLLSLGLLAASLSAAAHGGLTHVMGTVADMSATSLNVMTTDGKPTTITITAETKWVKAKAPIHEADVHTGDRVVIHAKPVSGKLIAVEVAVGTAH